MEPIKNLLNKTLLKESQDQVNDRLVRLSFKLQKLLPDPSLGPMERIERLARVIPSTYQSGYYHRTARAKLYEIEEKLFSLVPSKELTSEQRIDSLVEMVDILVPEKTDRICQKLQFIGDNRLRDNGSIPFNDWCILSLDLKAIIEKKRKEGLSPVDCSYIDESKYEDKV